MDVVDRIRDLARLVVPVECAGCGADDEPWCAPCARLLAGPPRRVEERAGRLDLLDGRPPLPVWALADNTGPVRRAVVRWKDRGRVDLTRRWRPELTRAAAHLGPVLPGGGRDLLVVPVPSTAAARRRRGADLVRDLAVAVAAGLPGAGGAVPVVPALARRSGADQVGLGARARGANVRVRVRSHLALAVAGRDVLLVDDVLTTGASLAACARALRAAGARPVAAVVLASTPPPQPTARAGDEPKVIGRQVTVGVSVEH